MNRREKRQTRVGRPQPAIGSLLQQAIGLQQAGRLDEAETLYRRVLDAVPQQPDALHLLGVLRHQRGDSDAGLRLMRRAAAATPDHAPLHANIAEAARSVGKTAAALKAYDRALSLDPALVDARLSRAELRREGDQIEAAIADYLRATQTRPDDREIWKDLFELAVRRGYCQRVVDLFAGMPQALRADPALLRLLAEAQRRTGRRREALTTLASLSASGRLGDVVSHGELLEELGCIAEAIELYRTSAENAKPDEVAALLARVGDAQAQLGAAAQAQSAYRGALGHAPDTASAWSGLCAVDAVTAAEVEYLEALCRGGGACDTARAELLFALGAWRERQRDYDTAFAHFHAANRLVARQRRFDPQALRRYTDRIIETSDADWLAGASPAQLDGVAPIFIVGMPRSGTTLVERMLAAHPAVTAGGERDDLQRLVSEMPATVGDEYPQALRGLSPEDLDRLADDYRLRVTDALGSVGLYTDKLPSNYLRLGLIARLLPQARIIHCRRDPVDTCVSCWTTHFRQGQSFAYDLAHLGSAYRDYRRLMAHWRRVLPGRFLEVDYENVVADPQGCAKRLVDYCGLSWDPACADFHRRPGVVRTASLWQVRRAVHTRSVGRWRAYGERFEPLLATLGEIAAESSVGGRVPG